MVHLRRFTFVALATVFLFAASAVRAQPASPATDQFDMDKMMTMLRNMGYEPKIGSSGKTFSVVYNGKYDLTMTIGPAKSGHMLIAYIYLQKYNPDEMKKLNMMGMLVANDTNLSYFSLSKDGNDYNVYLQETIVMPAVTAVSMRALMNDLATATYSTENLWDKAKATQ